MVSVPDISREHPTKRYALRAMRILLWTEGMGWQPDQEVEPTVGITLGSVRVTDSDGMMAQILGTSDNYIC